MVAQLLRLGRQDRSALPVQVGGRGTNLALRSAGARHDAPWSANRFVLLSDGRQKAGNAIAGRRPRRMRARHGYVPAPITFKQGGRQVNDAAREDKFGEPSRPRSSPGARKRRKGAAISERRVLARGRKLNAGRTSLSYRRRSSRADHVIRARSSRGRLIEENNRRSARGRARPAQVLMVEKDRVRPGADGRAREQHIDVDVVEAERIPSRRRYEEYEGSSFPSVLLKMTKQQMEGIRDTSRHARPHMLGGEKDSAGRYYRTPTKRAAGARGRRSRDPSSQSCSRSTAGSMAMTKDDKGPSSTREGGLAYRRESARRA